MKKVNTILTLLSFGCCAIILQSCSHTPNNSGTDQNTDTSRSSSTQTIPVVQAELHTLREKIDLPGELVAYQDVPIHAKVEGFISWIGVDRASKVKKGQKMIVITCPELIEKTNEGEAKVTTAQDSYRQSKSTLQSTKSKQIEAKAKLDADELTYSRLMEAAKTPGAIAQNDIDLAEKTVEADQARLDSMASSVEAAKAVVQAEKSNVAAARDVLSSLKDMQSYLTILAPFDGVITERNVHTGSIVSVDASRTESALPLVRIQQTMPLRLVIAVPEDAVGTLHEGDSITFTVPAYPGKLLTGIVVRPAYAIDTKTRTMPVELNVPNADNGLSPGMFATVKWTVSRPYKSIFLPASAVATDLKGSYVIKINNGIVERVTVKKRDPMGNLIEVTGGIAAGDQVALKATDELVDGSRVITHPVSYDELNKANSEGNKSSGE